MTQEALAQLRAKLILAALALPAQPEVQELIREKLLELAAQIDC